MKATRCCMHPAASLSSGISPLIDSCRHESEHDMGVRVRGRIFPNLTVTNKQNESRITCISCDRDFMWPCFCIFNNDTVVFYSNMIVHGRPTYEMGVLSKSQPLLFPFITTIKIFNYTLNCLRLWRMKFIPCRVMWHRFPRGAKWLCVAHCGCDQQSGAPNANLKGELAPPISESLVTVWLQEI